jgi:hypothetical protein
MVVTKEDEFQKEQLAIQRLIGLRNTYVTAGQHMLIVEDWSYDIGDSELKNQYVFNSFVKKSSNAIRSQKYRRTNSKPNQLTTKSTFPL